MRANAIGRVIEKLNAMQHTAEAVEALEAQQSQEVPVELPELPDVAIAKTPGRPDNISPSRPEAPGLSDNAAGEDHGRPDIIPATRPKLPEAATMFCKETGLPMKAMADYRDEEECDEPDIAVF